MKILPPIAQPWRRKIPRRHQPKPAGGKRGFRLYRACLRWDFGFTCAFCLCHEADLAAYGAEGTGLTHVEHFTTQRRNPDGRNAYKNCYYICRFCNGARGNAPNRDRLGRVLLDPCGRVWQEVFVRVEERLTPRDPEDGDAAYTLEKYDLNEPRKIKARQMRQRRIAERLGFLEDTRGEVESLLDLAAEVRKPELVRLAKEIRRARQLACDDLMHFQAVPEDCDGSCRCQVTSHHNLPDFMQEDTIDIVCGQGL